jgi:DNA-binding MarR family transcriptional regulator
VSGKQIAVALQLDLATLLPKLKRLEMLGEATRSRGTTDDRGTAVELTAEGFTL